MRTIKAIVLLIVFLTGCREQQERHLPVIVSKSNETYFNNPMPDGICRFFYREHPDGFWTEFKDSCYKYNIGDTIIGQRK